jgi:Fe-S-cluster containining protein
MLLPAEKKILGTAECITPHDPETLKCEFIKDGCCSVYDKRPFVCRIFNATPHPPFVCPEMQYHGTLSQEQIAELMDEFFNLLCITPADEVMEYLQCMEKYQHVMVEHDARNGWIERDLS